MVPSGYDSAPLSCLPAPSKWNPPIIISLVLFWGQVGVVFRVSFGGGGGGLPSLPTLGPPLGNCIIKIHY